jgi:hypothetical protein
VDASIVTDTPVDLDKHRGMAAQKATDLRRLLSEVETNAQELRRRQNDLEVQLAAAPAATWAEAAEKARYLLRLFVASLPTEDTQRRRLIDAVLDDLERLARDL